MSLHSTLCSLFLYTCYIFHWQSRLEKEFIRRSWRDLSFQLNCGVRNWLFNWNLLIIEVYKYYTLFKALLTLDWVINFFFVLTVNHFMHQQDISYLSVYVLLPIGSQFFLVSGTAFWGIKAVSNKNARLHKWIGVLRIFIEVIKLI